MRTMGEEGVSKKYLRPIQSASLGVGLRHQCTLEAPHILWDQVEDHCARRMGCLETYQRQFCNGKRDGLEPKTLSEFGSLHSNCVSWGKPLVFSRSLRCLL